MSAEPEVSMAERKKKLEQYLDDYAFSESSKIRKQGDTIWIPELFCHNGHSLMVYGVRFDGLPAVHIQVEVGGEGGPNEDFYLSPILDDSRKEGPELPEGTQLKLVCPVCHEELKKLVPCTCRVAAYRRAIYLSPDPDELGAVGICEVYGCPQSFVTEDGELLYEVVVEHGHD
jgi:hypothetical protein